MLRRLRGVVGTAIAWALPWAAIGAGLLTVLASFGFPGAPTPPPSILLDMFVSGAVAFGAIGALSGAAFAIAVALGERRSSFGDLTFTRMSAWGALGGGIIGLGYLVLLSQVNGRFVPLWPLVGVSAVLGTTSAVAMLWLARRGSRGAAAAELGAAPPQAPPFSAARETVPRRTS